VINISSTLLEENLYRSIRDKYQFVEHLRIIFKDNGIGFDDQYRDYVFELVTKAHVGRTGLGIGLALIKKIVDNHGGTVRIESEAGKGTSVFLVLPLRMSGM
jgi:signal transduction histidine kinase